MEKVRHPDGISFLLSLLKKRAIHTVSIQPNIEINDPVAKGKRPD